MGLDTQRADITDEERDRALGSYIEGIVASGAYPRFSMVVRDADLPHANNRNDVLFDTALDRVLTSVVRAPEK